jgi:folate-binding protein YgfZ
MSPEWQAFLDTRTIQPWPDEGGADLFVDLSERGIIAVRGGDSAKFLQGQLTLDVSEVRADRSQLGAWCSAKGRVQVVLRAFRRGEGFLLSLPRELAGPTARRMTMFVLRADVKIADESDAWVQIGCQGAAAARRLVELCGTLPGAVNAVSGRGELAVTKVLGDPPRFELIAPPDAARAAWEALSEVARPSAGGAWALGDVRAGLPRIQAESADQYLPQMLNLELLGGVSFTKGCYVGQEIVARAHYRGRIKRRMRRALVEGAAVPATGASVLLRGQDEPAGRILYAAASGRQASEALVVLPTDADLEPGLFLEDGRRLTLEPLPYEASIDVVEPAPGT